jgi:sporulation protein YunB
MRIRGRRRLVNVRLVVFLTLVLFLFSIVQLLLYAEQTLQPAMLTMAEEFVKKKATEAINRSIAKRVAEETNYSRLVNFREGANGKVTAGYFNLQEAGRIQERAVLSVQEELEHLQEQELSVPLGMAIGSPFFSDLGPEVKVKVLPVGHVTSDVKWQTKDVGINQSVHILYLDLHVDARVIIPFASKETQVKAKAPIAYLVMVGDVPQMVYNAKGESIAPGTNSLRPDMQLPKLDGEAEEEP